MECREHLDNCLDRWVKERLRENRPGLLEDISVSGTLYDHVYSKKILNKETLETIKSSGIEVDQKRKLLDELEKRGLDAYQHFHDALREDEQGHVVEKYLTSYRSFKYLIIQRIQEELARVYDIPRAVGRFSTNPISNTDAIFNDNDLDLFQKRIDSNGNGISPRRIVIRQSVGTDENSSIPKELAADWARSVLNSSKGRAILQKFKLVLKLNLREVHSGDTLKSIIQSQLLPGPPGFIQI